MKHEEKCLVEIKRTVPIVQLHEIIRAFELLARWPGMTVWDIRDLVPQHLTPYALKETYEDHAGENVYMCAKGVSLPTAAASILTESLPGVVFDLAEVRAYEHDHSECKMIKISTEPEEPVTAESVGQLATQGNENEATKPRSAHAIVKDMKAEKATKKQIAAKVDENCPGLTHSQLGELLADDGDIRNTAADKKRGQRARGKAR